MGIIIVFLGLAAVLGTVCYLIVRWLFWETWTQWRHQRLEGQEDQRREQHTQALRREALDKVLAQIGGPDDQSHKAA